MNKRAVSTILYAFEMAAAIFILVAMFILARTAGTAENRIYLHQF